MIITGIIGGIASGKSFVSETLHQLGACVLNADQIGHQVLLTDDVKKQIRARWGDRVFGDDGEIHRRRLAEIVFNPDCPVELQELEKITHPLIGQRIREQIDREKNNSQCPMLVLDAPVMIKAGWYRVCDLLLFVDCPRSRRLEFARQRGWDEKTFEQREACQTPVETKRSMATHVVENFGTLAELRQQVHKFWASVVKTTET